jgi:hypothetical protein
VATSISKQYTGTHVIEADGVWCEQCQIYFKQLENIAMYEVDGDFHICEDCIGKFIEPYMQNLLKHGDKPEIKLERKVYVRQ